MLLRSWVEAGGPRRADRLGGGRAAANRTHSTSGSRSSTRSPMRPAKELVERIGPTPGFAARRWSSGCWRTSIRSKSRSCWSSTICTSSIRPRRCAWLELFSPGVRRDLRMVLTSREEPQLGLHRLRLAGELTEIRDPDLRFSPEEARELLRGERDRALGRGGGPASRADGGLGRRPAAGGDLARRAPRPRAVRERVLRQRAHRRGLPDGGGAGAPAAGGPRAAAADLDPRPGERAAGRLPDRRLGLGADPAGPRGRRTPSSPRSTPDRSWFRYHHLFADLLRLELRRTDPASIESLHRKAARWYEEHGHPVEAIRHAQAAEDWGYAARLLADSYFSLFLMAAGRRSAGCSPTFLRRRATEDPELAIALAGAGLFEGRPEEATSYIDLAERQAADGAGGAAVALRAPALPTRSCGTPAARGDLSAAREAMRVGRGGAGGPAGGAVPRWPTTGLRRS